ncbi:MAG TPA: LacI family DNA-binding transcriptional regulator [Pseudonocardia sp.]|jgi:LacI family transcriptional regulator
MDGGYVTLAQVASAARVSLATASRVLNGGARVVRPELRDRVLAAARRLSYVPNAHAQALAGGATATVGLVMHDVSDPYFASITRGAMQVAAEHGVLVVLGSTFRSPEREIEYVSLLRGQRTRAILLVGSGFTDPGYLREMGAELAGYQGSGGRYAFISHHDLPGAAVLPDNRGGAAEVARALVRLGHRRIAVAGGPPRLNTVEHRVGGFVEALAAAGVPSADVTVVEREFSEEGGYVAAHDLVTAGLPATALFCASDVMAIGALLALRERGVAVPGRLSLIGFDDIPIARHLTPALSTVALDLEEMGRRAMELVLACPRPGADPDGGDGQDDGDDRDTGESGDREPEDSRVWIPARLVLRDSTGPPP